MKWMDQQVLHPVKTTTCRNQKQGKDSSSRQTFKREVTTDDIIWVTVPRWWSCVPVPLLLKLSQLLLEISHMFLQFSRFSLQSSWCEMTDKHMICIWGSCCEIHATPSQITFVWWNKVVSKDQVASGKATSHQQDFIYTWKGRSSSSILVRACKLSLTTLNISSDIDWNSWEHNVLSKKLSKTWIRA